MSDENVRICKGCGGPYHGRALLPSDCDRAHITTLQSQLAARDAEVARLRAALEDIAQTTGRVGLFPTDTLIEILDVARAALAAPTSGDADADH